MTKKTRRRQSAFARAVQSAILGLLLLAAIVLPEPSTVSAQVPAPGWTVPADISEANPAGNDLYGSLICDPNQNLHILWTKSHANGSEIYYRTDASGALSAPIDVLAMPDPLAIHLGVTFNPRDWTLHLTWQNSYIRGDVLYSRAPLAQASDPHAWSTPTTVVPQADSAGIIADESGALHLVYGVSDTGGYSNSIYHARSDDGGLSWGEPSLIYEARSVVPSTIGAAMAFDRAGRMHVGITIRSQEYGVYSELGYMRSLDGGETWQPYRAIATQNPATPNVSVLVPWIVGENEIHLTWHDPRRMHMWSKDGGVTWSDPIRIIDLGAGFGGANFLARDSAGVLRAATGVGNGVYVSTLKGSEWGSPEQIENRSMDPHGQQLTVCQGNQLHLVYDDRVVKDTTVWYSHKQVDAPHIERSPIPTTQVSRTNEVSRTNVVSASLAIQAIPPMVEPTAIAKRSPALTLNPTPPPVTAGGALAPVLLSAMAVVVLMCIVFGFRKLRGW
jgi:hypothetical protein